MERIEMSQEERDKLEWLKRARDRMLSQREAAQKMGVSERGGRQQLQRMKQRGDAVVVHGLRGRASTGAPSRARQRPHSGCVIGATHPAGEILHLYHAKWNRFITFPIGIARSTAPSRTIAVVLPNPTTNASTRRRLSSMNVIENGTGSPAERKLSTSRPREQRPTGRRR